MQRLRLTEMTKAELVVLAGTLYDIIDDLDAKPPTPLIYGTVKPLVDQMNALHALLAHAAMYSYERICLCRYCKRRLDQYYPKRHHDPQCPIIRVMRGDIPKHLRQTDEGWPNDQELI